MKLVFFAHPSFLGSQSMARFASMLSEGMEERGHTVQVWSPKARFFRIPLPNSIKKWMGYIDQYIIFRLEVRIRLKGCSPNTIFVFTDNALGPWVPWVNDRPHVTHCHDFLAQRSALDEIIENPTSWTGKLYQSFIRRGYLHGKNFISVSEKTKADLHRFLKSPPLISEVVYNGLNQSFSPYDQNKARTLLSNATDLYLSSGYILHIGGNQWYKNRIGVIEIYNAFRAMGGVKLPLLLVGKKPDLALLEAYESSQFKTEIHFLFSIGDDLLRSAYAGATVFIFPSLAEGFGWPIAEAMASGCPVITTNEAPMTEVAGDAGFLIPHRPGDQHKIKLWAAEAAKVVNQVVELSVEERQKVIEIGLLNSKRFDFDDAINRIEQLYQNIAEV
jgi:glycosyltransferase involved in cell wall biosynthesis